MMIVCSKFHLKEASIDENNFLLGRLGSAKVEGDGLPGVGLSVCNHHCIPILDWGLL